FGVLISTVIILFSNTKIRTTIDTTSDPTHLFQISMTTIFTNLLPLIIFVVVTAIGLYFFSDIMIKLFIFFGRILDACIKLVFVYSVVEFLLGLFINIYVFCRYTS